MRRSAVKASTCGQMVGWHHRLALLVRKKLILNVERFAVTDIFGGVGRHRSFWDAELRMLSHKTWSGHAAKASLNVARRARQISCTVTWVSRAKGWVVYQGMRRASVENKKRLPLVGGSLSCRRVTMDDGLKSYF